ncbi:hypothetical protein RND81_01G178700 [Saponaria officinalis]|uniref:Transposase n=1 Tax=Saponaria officinalis TaxID=3572 RepID=A0AAW1NGX3_SAPOF
MAPGSAKQPVLVGDDEDELPCNNMGPPVNAQGRKLTSDVHILKCARRVNHDIRNFCISGNQFGNSNSPLMSLRNPTVNLEEVRRAIGIYVVAGAHPFSTCDEPGFRNMVLTMCPQFNCVSRHTLKRDILKHYNEEKDIIKAHLMNRSEHTDDEYMCITAHWIDSEWELQKRIVQFKALTPPFDGQSLSDEISLFLGQWKIDNKVMAFTVDNASYNDSMIGFLKGDLEWKKSLFFVVKIRSVVKYFKHSIPKKKKFLDVAKTMFHLNTKKKLRGDNLIRWNSTFLMLDRFLYYKNVVDHVVGCDKDIKQFALSIEEWNRVSELHDFLKIFHDVTNTFSALKSPTSNLYFEGVWRIHRKLIEVLKGPLNSLSKMASDMEKKFEKYWSYYSLLLSCAAVLDPRFKLDKVEYYYELLFGETYAKVVANNIRNTLIDLFDDYAAVSCPSSSTFSNSSNRGTPLSTDSTTSSGALDLEERGFKNFMEKMRRLANNKSELEMFCHIGKKNGARFPNLSCMARDILAILISTVPSESAFSMSKKLINPWRASLGESTIEALACYEDWLHAKRLSSGKLHIHGPLPSSYDDTSSFDDVKEEDEEEGEEEEDDENEEDENVIM